MSSQVYATRLAHSSTELDAAAWDALLQAQAAPTPFMRHAYLHAMEQTQCAAPRSGWTPLYLTLHDAQGLAAATPLYLKTHSYGEYVFDWAWADAYRRHGLAYYPKLLGAVPFTPVPGSRLLGRDAAAQRALAKAVLDLAQTQRLSSAHLLFLDDADRVALRDAGWMLRQGVQFHWTASPQQPVASFDDLLATMQRHKRKNILQERRRVAEAGVRFEVHEGPAIDDGLWDFFHHCYTLTYQAHGSTPYLNRAFFRDMARHMPEHWVMFVARRDGQRIAASLLAIDRARRAAYGRYWGSTQYVPHLHFEACYYQPLQWCIEQAFERFEGGAQGEHKMARGLLPVSTCSAHWIRDPRFAGAVEEFLAREGAGVGLYIDELREHSPFRPTGALSSSSPSPC
jgi:uncharacterized protein